MADDGAWKSVRRKPLGIYRYACSQHSRHHTAAICTETQGKIPQRNEREKQNPLPARKYAERFGIIFSPLQQLRSNLFLRFGRSCGCQKRIYLSGTLQDKQVISGSIPMRMGPRHNPVRD